MALYLNSESKIINLNGKRYYLNLAHNKHINTNNLLMSSDEFILKDSNGVYLIAKPVSDDTI